MRRNLIRATLLTAFGLAVALGVAATASAAPASQSSPIVLTNADIDALLFGADLDHRGPGRGGALHACRAAVKALKTACPCEGVDMDGDGVLDPWGTHDAFMECVNAAADALKSNADDPLPEQCVPVVDQAVERLGNSEIGNEGYECPTHDCKRGRGGPRGPGGEG